MKYEGSHLIFIKKVENVHRFSLLEIVLRVDGRRRFLAFLSFGAGMEFIWTVNCHCRDCQIKRKIDFAKKLHIYYDGLEQDIRDRLAPK